ncbi:odorant receptor 82a-like [Cardiocondyla obscurior]|uniref:odorant receptor 82a-like n=1 Tax=Cardiocondyla obscurior TaxID=286306 RepID=UPI0039657DFE
MKTEQEQTYRKYHRFIQTLITISGCSHVTKIGKISTVISLLVNTLYSVIRLYKAYYYRHNLSIMMSYIGGSTSSLGSLLKMIRCVINHDIMMNYRRTLNDLFENEYMENEKIQTIMNSSLPSIIIMVYIYSAIYIIVIVMITMPGCISIFNFYHSNSTTNYTLPSVRGYGYLWIIVDFIRYHYRVLFGTLELMIICLISFCVDTAFGLYAYQFAAIIDSMHFKLTNPLPTENISDTLKTCVAKHQKLLLCRDILENMYAPIVLWHIVTNAVLLCALIYELSLQQLSDLNFISIFTSLTYSGVKLLQTFIYAWHGTLLADASEKLRNGIYFSKWHNSRLDRHVRTNVILIMMQKPMSINAYFASVDMILFTNFVNTTISYFFLLQSVSDKNE